MLVVRVEPHHGVVGADVVVDDLTVLVFREHTGEFQHVPGAPEREAHDQALVLLEPVARAVQDQHHLADHVLVHEVTVR